MTYNFSATQNNGRIVSSSDGITGENVSYTYDSLNRLIAAATTNGTGPIWGNSYSYDGFGNLTGKTVTQGTAPSALPQVNSATNQARMIGDYGFDANGNWLGMGSQSNAWNAENQLISNGTVDYGGNPLTYTYDPWGKRVLQYSVGGATGPTETIYFYSITGQRLAIYTGQYPNELTQTSVNMYFGGRLLAPVDRLGSVRYNQNGPIAYFPWGEERTSTPDGTDKFGTYFRDATNNGIGEDYASARYYNNNFGRFWSSDPKGLQSVDPSDPTSWNRYIYANDDPVNLSDPSGLKCINENGVYGDDGLGKFCQAYGLPVPTNTYSTTVTSTSCDWGGVLCTGFSPTSPGWPQPPNPCPLPGGCSSTGSSSSGSSSNPTQDPTPQDPCTQIGKALAPAFYAAEGAAAKGNFFLTMLDLSSFSRGGYLDAQPYGASPAYANYAYGVFMAAAGFSLEVAIEGAELYGLTATYNGQLMAGSVPAANILNIVHGYLAEQNGTLCTH